jgi:squalene-hopene/tetraprenyl-beta-curcumene cyclase
MFRGNRFLATLCAFLALVPATSAQEAKQDATKLLVNSPDEPVAKQVSFTKTAAFLDHQSRAWTQVRKCGTCHTNYPYLLARGQLGGDLAALQEVRGFFEQRIANWDSGKKEDKPRWDTEVVATAATLAIQDALTTGKLQPLTRQALDRMWTLQRADGGWDWIKCAWPPMEHDDYYGVVYAAVGVGHAPDKYAQSESAKPGMEKLRRYFNFKTNPPPSLHHKAMLLWASQKVDGLMSDKMRKSTIIELLALQKTDGGWSLPSLGDWVGRDELPNDKNAPSDGYATGLVIYILRQAGQPAKSEPIQKGVAWLKSNQRESGRWFTRSVNTNHYHFITHAGTAYAVLALKACE